MNTRKQIDEQMNTNDRDHRFLQIGIESVKCSNKAIAPVNEKMLS